MLVLECKLNDGVILKDEVTGKQLVKVKIASIVQYPSHTGIRLGLDAPQNIKISRLNGKKDLKAQDVKTDGP